MGFWNNVKRVFTAPIKVHADITRKVGELLEKSNVTVVWRTGFALQDFADKIEPKCYKSSTASVTETVDFESRCKEYYNMAIIEITPKIDNIIEIAKKDLLDKKRVLQYCVSDDVFEQIKSVISTANFDFEKKEALDSMARAFSNDNTEFLKIVEIVSDEDRKKEWKKYECVKINEIGAKFADSINKKKNEIILSLIRIAKNYCKQQEDVLLEVKKQYDEMVKEQNNPDFVSNRFTEKAVDIAYSKCILSLLYQ